MGLMVEDNENPEKNFVVLTDIQGPEDHHGDMDFKVAGTKDGVTAIQMDVKINGSTPKILSVVLEEAKKARIKILESMAKIIEKPKDELSQYAPRIITLTIDPEKIGAVIGPGGKVINKIIEETGVDINIEDDGSVFISSEGEDGDAQRAYEWVKDLTREVVPGEIYTGKVVKTLDFGAFVEILPNKQGLVHISELAPWHVGKVEDIVKVGQTVKVRVKEIDSEGRLNLTMKEFQSKEPASTDSSRRSQAKTGPSRDLPTQAGGAHQKK